MLIECNTDDEFRQQMSAAGSKPVLVDFTATWCGPCKAIAPLFKQLADATPSMTFLKVDVDKCSDTAMSNGVSAMPTFILFINQKKMDQFKGGNEDMLRALVEKWSKVSGGAAAAAEVVPGQINLSGFIEMKQIECLNGCDNTPARDLLENPESILRSDCDEQLILTIPFIQPVKLHTIFIKGVGGKTPKRIRIFANLPKTLDFDDALGVEPIQILDLEESAQEGELIGLKYVKFQNVRNVQLFFENNQEGGEVTEIAELKFYGSTVAATNMDNFKRVSGKAGESGF